MNTEKLEKLKKSLDNKFIPDNVKDKIRNEIEKLESEIKSEDITPTELKKEVAKVEEKVEVAVDKAESTAPKKRRGRPAKAKVTPVEPKATQTAIKKTAMVVAKTIRKDGEKWNDAMKRANGVMKKEKVEVKKTTKSELDRLLARVRKNKSLMSELKGVKDLGRDAVRQAKPVGKRMSESGNVYYEYRANKTDRKTYGKYAFELGGSVVTDLAGHTGGGNAGLNAGMPLDGFSNTAYTGLVGETGAMSSGEMFMNGGGLKFGNLGENRSTKFIDKNFEVIVYPEKLEILIIITNEDTINQEGLDASGVKWREEDFGYSIEADNKTEFNKAIKVILGVNKRFANGGSVGMANQQVIDDASQGYVNYYLGEGASQGIYKDGGAIMNQYEGRTPKDIWDNLSKNQRKHFLIDHFYIEKEYFFQQQTKWLSVEDEKMINSFSTKSWDKLDSDVKKAFTSHVKEGQYAKGGGVRKVGNREYSYGRNWTNDHRHINQAEEHEVTYNRKGKFLGVFAGGGGVFADGRIVLRTFNGIGGNKNKTYSLIKDDRDSDGKPYFTLVEKPSGNIMAQGDDFEEVNNVANIFNGKFMNSIFAKGGGVENTKIKDWYIKNYPTDDLGQEINKNVTFEDIYITLKEKKDFYKKIGVGDSLVRERLFEHLSEIKKVNYRDIYNMWLDADYYAKGGGVRQVGNREYSLGRNWTNDHRHTNKSENHEVNYNRKRFFMAGGINEDTPKIYVVDLESYNNGKSSGLWLDLTDYSDADELMDAINDFLKTSGGEEYAVHDYENLPSSMYSEYMGVRDFEEIYEMIDLAKENDLPLDVAMEVVSQFDRSALDEFTGVYDSEQDFAEQLVDDIGIQSFNDFQYYLEISETDRRLLSQEMADGYVDDIRDEDGGNRLIEEAGLDVDEYEEADSDRQEEMLDEAREIVYDEYYNNYFEGLSDPYYFLVEEQGLYDAESFANANFVRVDYEKLGDALEQDYTFVRHDGQIYVFNIR